MVALTYAKAEKVSLKRHPELNELWLQDRIAEDPGILGLGELALLDRERRQERAGRLDLLLADVEQGLRYEVELQLGGTDESHIIRAIEYWDIERRRYPGHEHCAVLVAEDITSRFLNVLQLFAGSIPFVAVQLNALQVDDKIFLDFVRVVDQRLLRQDDETEGTEPPADRDYWLARSSRAVMDAADEIVKLVNASGNDVMKLNYRRNHIGLTDGGRARNFVRFVPRKSLLRLRVRLNDPKPWADRLEDATISTTVSDRGHVRFGLRPDELGRHHELLRELVQQATAEHEGR